MIALFAAALLGAGQPVCAPPSGMDALLALDRTFIVVGERHGTAETPAAFAEMVCAAAESGPVTVALEMADAEQPLFDAFLAAATDAEALEALNGGAFMDVRFDDGRTSKAMLEMLFSVRRLKWAGRDVAFHAFAARSSVIRDRPQAWWELEMAYGMSRALVKRPDARVLVLVGMLHARKTGYSRFPDVGLPAVGHLYGPEVVSLTTPQQGGESWSCAPDCGVHPSIVTYDADARGIRLEPFEDGAYDGVLALGPTTASPPSAPAYSAPTSSGSSS